ncbi:MAG: hypothetical protein HY049_10070 [Acidobacteria bacterium]|nr:hypothetical protein [Acidobacteriota bacterium]
MKRLVLAAALAALAALAATEARAQSQEPYVYIAPDFWHVALSGNGQTGRGSSDERFGVADTLGVDTSDTSRALESFIRLREKYLVEFGLAHGDFSGSTNVSSIFTFKNHTFLPGSRIRSDMKVDHKKLLYGSPFLAGRTLTAGVRVGLYRYDLETSVKQSGTGSPDVSLKSTVPIIGASLSFIPAQALRIHGEVLSTALDRGGVRSRVQEGYAALDYILFARSVGITVGYRYSSLRSEDSGRAKLDIKEKGTFFGIVVKL